jgi:hypothetical protein
MVLKAIAEVTGDSRVIGGAWLRTIRAAVVRCGGAACVALVRRNRGLGRSLIVEGLTALVPGATPPAPAPAGPPLWEPEPIDLIAKTRPPAELLGRFGLNGNGSTCQNGHRAKEK